MEAGLLRGRYGCDWRRKQGELRGDRWGSPLQSVKSEKESQCMSDISLREKRPPCDWLKGLAATPHFTPHGAARALAVDGCATRREARAAPSRSSRVLQ